MTHILCERKSGNIANPNYICFCVVLRDLGFFCDSVLKVTTQLSTVDRRAYYNAIQNVFVVKIKFLITDSTKKSRGTDIFGFCFVKMT